MVDFNRGEKEPVMEEDDHLAALDQLCRVCLRFSADKDLVDRLSLAAEFAAVYGVDVTAEADGLYPPNVCHLCLATMKLRSADAKLAAQPLGESLPVFQSHGGDACKICSDFASWHSSSPPVAERQFTNGVDDKREVSGGADTGPMPSGHVRLRKDDKHFQSADHVVADDISARKCQAPAESSSDLARGSAPNIAVPSQNDERLPSHYTKKSASVSGKGRSTVAKSRRHMVEFNLEHPHHTNGTHSKMERTIAEKKATKVLIAVDDSQYAEHAFDFYFAKLYNSRAEVILVHAFKSPCMAVSLSSAGGGYGTPVTFENRQLDAVMRATNAENGKLKERYLKKIHDFPVKVSYKFHMVEHMEDAGHVIVSIAAREHAQMVVVGTRGSGIVRRTILGSISDYVLQHSHVPVLVCHKEHHQHHHNHHHHLHLPWKHHRKIKSVLDTDYTIA